MSTDATAPRPVRGGARRVRGRARGLGLQRRRRGRLAAGIRETGAILVLARQTIVAAVRPPYSYGAELSSQFLFGLRMAWFPMILASIAFTYGPAGIQAAGFLNRPSEDVDLFTAWGDLKADPR